MQTSPEAPAYDAFGEPAPRPRLRSSPRERRIAVALFWSVALLLIAGRVYQNDLVAPQSPTLTVASR